MPEIAVAPSPASPVPSAAPQAASEAGNQNGGTPFADHLARQMSNAKTPSSEKPQAAPKDDQASVNAAAFDAVNATNAAPSADLLAMLLPLMGKGAAAAPLPQAAPQSAEDTAQMVADSGIAALPITPQIISRDSAPTRAGKGDKTADPAVAKAAVDGEAQAALNSDGRQNGGKAAAIAAQPAANLAPVATAVQAADEKEIGLASKTHGALGNGGEASQSFQALLQSAQAAAPTAHRATEAAATARIDTPVGQPGWSHEVGDKLAWMVGKQESRAELILTPPNMGRIEISLTLNGDQANASFVSSNPAVREALESALPRLREVLADAGVRLDQAQVGADSTPNQSSDGGNKPHNSGRGSDSAAVAASASDGLRSGSPANWLRQGNGMVDTFA
ncbi:MAG TPA: flagellar hook-length control protein FliK [Rhodocyclaceae bacterium]